MINQTSISTYTMPIERTAQGMGIGMGVAECTGFRLAFWPAPCFRIDFQLLTQAKPFGLPWPTAGVFWTLGLLAYRGLCFGLCKPLLIK